MAAADLKDVSTHFSFGENWRDYAQHIDAAAISEAEKGLLKLISPDQLHGSRFLDIGCGSGLHSLAAVRLGVAEVVAIDLDLNSVETTQNVLKSHVPLANFDIKQLSVFDPKLGELEKFDIVYSWGVLHHTGDMWLAIDKASDCVKPGGVFVIALYQKRITCAAWKVEKKLYTNSPSVIQTLIKGLFCSAFMLGLMVTGRNPITYVRNYKSARGMNFFNDVHDWLGGYPYESATPQEVETYLGRNGFVKIKSFPIKKGFGIFGTGCAEYTFSKK
jgi:SAM-dependent methyltransferase